MSELSEEYCPHCESIVMVAPDKANPCRYCGEKLYPCNACLDGSDDSKCDWEEGKGCSKFPEESEDAE